jgi:RsiW-degrading membrane proteinase PrsW (M82 family)
MHELAFFLQHQPDPEVVKRMMMLIIPIILTVYLVVVVIVMVPCWFILKKAGFSPWLSLLCIMTSLGTLVLLYVLAFAEWKVVPAPQASWPQPPYPQPPLPPQSPAPPQA